MLAGRLCRRVAPADVALAAAVAVGARPRRHAQGALCVGRRACARRHMPAKMPALVPARRNRRQLQVAAARSPYRLSHSILSHLLWLAGAWLTKRRSSAGGPCGTRQGDHGQQQHCLEGHHDCHPKHLNRAKGQRRPKPGAGQLLRQPVDLPPFDGCLPCAIVGWRQCYSLNKRRGATRECAPRALKFRSEPARGPGGRIGAEEALYGVSPPFRQRSAAPGPEPQPRAANVARRCTAP